MASEQIRLNQEQMKERSRQYRAAAETVNGVISNMDRLLGQLQSEWEGASSEAYTARYLELKPSFQKAEALIVEIADALNAAADYLSNADDAVARTMKG